MAKCMLCYKGPVRAHNVPNSQHKTNRMLKPNIQKFMGAKVCTRCLRTLKKDLQVSLQTPTAQ